MNRTLGIFILIFVMACTATVWADIITIVKTDPDDVPPTFTQQFTAAFNSSGLNTDPGFQGTVASLAAEVSNSCEGMEVQVVNNSPEMTGPSTGSHTEYRYTRVDFSDAQSLLNSASYWSTQTLNMISGYAKQGTPTSYKTLYAEERQNLIESYLKEVRDASGRGNYASDYASYFSETYTNYHNQMNYLNSPEPDYRSAFKSSDKVCPDDYFDKPLKNYSKRGIDIDFCWAGVSDMYKYYTPKQILGLLWYNSSSFVAKDGGSPFDAAAKKELQGQIAWFMSVWPPASEMLVMANNYNTDAENYREDKWSDKQYGAYERNMILDEYGQLVPASDASANTNYDVAKETIDFTHQTGSYNNRNYGYRYNYGNHNQDLVGVTKPTIKVTAGGKTYELTQNVMVSPLVLDMDGDGKLEASAGKWAPHEFTNTKVVEFDMDGDGFIDLTEWVGPNDGLLMVYKGSEEVSGNDLFGEAGGFRDGYQKLSSLDANKDNTISGEELKTLSIWQDKNSNAKVDKDEVTSVTQLNITGINLDHKRLVSSFVQNGQTKTLWDWYPVVIEVKKKKTN